MVRRHLHRTQRAEHRVTFTDFGTVSGMVHGPGHALAALATPAHPAHRSPSWGRRPLARLAAGRYTAASAQAARRRVRAARHAGVRVHAYGAALCRRTVARPAGAPHTAHRGLAAALAVRAAWAAARRAARRARTRAARSRAGRSPAASSHRRTSSWLTPNRAAMARPGSPSPRPTGRRPGRPVVSCARGSWVRQRPSHADAVV
jgi:hypothetical protein